MHPNPAFRMTGDALAFVGRIGFAHVVMAHDGGLWCAHVPVLVEAGRILFHLSNGNAMTAPLHAGARVLVSVADCGHYVSANWYPDPAGNVPTWNYTAVEVEGPVTPLDMAGLEALLHLASAVFEPRVGEDWTMAKMERRQAEAMMRGITGFALTPEVVRTTHKHSQNRSAADADAVAGAMARRGNRAGAAAIRGARG